jgi:hypothetical protein
VVYSPQFLRRLCFRVSDGVFGCQMVWGLISDGVSDCVWGGRTGPTIKPKHTISQQSHNNLTTISQQSHNNLTTISQQSDKYFTTISQQSHNNLTAISQQSDKYFTTISHNLTTISHYLTTISKNNFTISSKNYNFAHFLSTFIPLNSHFNCALFQLIFNEKNFKKSSKKH